MNVLIFCAGMSKRHPMFLKQLRMCGKETILQRIIRQCQERKLRPFYVVTNHKEIMRHARSKNAMIAHPTKTRWLAESIFRTSVMWDERTIFLLGDVIYSKFYMDAISLYVGDLMWFGDHTESYALSFSDKWNKRIAEACERVIAKDLPYYEGSLRQTFFEATGLYEEILFNHDVQVTRVLDYTRDIDTAEDYSNFLKQVIALNQLDDKP